MRCDYIAEGVIKATKELQLRVPLIVRLKGNKEAEAKEYVSIQKLRFHCFKVVTSLLIHAAFSQPLGSFASPASRSTRLMASTKPQQKLSNWVANRLTPFPIVVHFLAHNVPLISLDVKCFTRNSDN